MAQVPINPEVLRWAIKTSGVTAQDLTTITGRSKDVVDGWLTGDKKPLKGDVDSFAKRLGRSNQFFLLPRPPASAPSVALFRSAVVGKPRDETDELNAVRSAQRLQRVATWAEPAQRAIEFPRMSKSPQKSAARFQDALGWNIDFQIKATSKSALFKKLRSHVEDLGIIVLLQAIGVDNCRGFSLPDSRAPLILVNKSYDLASLRTYTLLHELAHLASGDARICHTSDSRAERWCDEFAAAFLLPEQHLRSYLEFKKCDFVKSNNLDLVRLISERYKASWHAVAIRLKELGLADQSLVDVVAAGSGEVPGIAFSRTPRTRPVHRIDEFGTRFTRLILRARESEKLTELDARRYLKVNGQELNEVHGLLRGAS